MIKKTIIIFILCISTAQAEDWVQLKKSDFKPVEAAFMSGTKAVVLGGISVGSYWINGKYQKYKTAMKIAETAKQLAQARKARALAKKKAVKPKSNFSKFKKGFNFSINRNKK